MKISNLALLLNAKILQEGSVASVGGFATDLCQLRPGEAFFSAEPAHCAAAAAAGAYVIIGESSKNISNFEPDIFYLGVEDLGLALLRLARFLCEEKKLSLLHLPPAALGLGPGFELKILRGNIQADLALIAEAVEGELLAAADPAYLLELGSSYSTLPQPAYELLPSSSVFFTSLICAGQVFRRLALPEFYAPVFAGLAQFFAGRVDFDPKKISPFKVYFVDEKNHILPFGESGRAFILSLSREDFRGWEGLLRYQSGVKIIRACQPEELKKMRDFRYCLVRVEGEAAEEFVDKFVEDFERLFTRQPLADEGLFDSPPKT